MQTKKRGSKLLMGGVSAALVASAIIPVIPVDVAYATPIQHTGEATVDMVKVADMAIGEVIEVENTRFVKYGDTLAINGQEISLFTEITKMESTSKVDMEESALKSDVSSAGNYKDEGIAEMYISMGDEWMPSTTTPQGEKNATMHEINTLLKKHMWRGAFLNAGSVSNPLDSTDTKQYISDYVASGSSKGLRETSTISLDTLAYGDNLTAEAKASNLSIMNLKMNAYNASLENHKQATAKGTPFVDSWEAYTNAQAITMTDIQAIALNYKLGLIAKDELPEHFGVLNIMISDDESTTYMTGTPAYIYANYQLSDDARTLNKVPTTKPTYSLKLVLLEDTEFAKVGKTASGKQIYKYVNESAATPIPTLTEKQEGDKLQETNAEYTFSYVEGDVVELPLDGIYGADSYNYDIEVISGADVVSASIDTYRNVLTLKGKGIGSATLNITAKSHADETNKALKTFNINYVANNKSAPKMLSAIPKQTVTLGASLTLDLLPYIDSKSLETLKFNATSSNDNVATVKTSTGTTALVITPNRKGEVVVKGTANDSFGTTKEFQFDVNVNEVAVINNEPSFEDADATKHNGDKITVADKSTDVENPIVEVKPNNSKDLDKRIDSLVVDLTKEYDILALSITGDKADIANVIDVVLTEKEISVKLKDGDTVKLMDLPSEFGADFENLRAIRQKRLDQLTVMHYTTDKSLILTTDNLKNVLITSRVALPFDDVSKNSWAYGDIEEAYNYNMVKGTTETTFEPTAELTRGQFAGMLARALEITAETKYSGFDLSDLGTQWYANDAQMLVDLGIVTGFTDGTFGGGKTLTRQQAIAMIGRAIEYLGVEISDVTATNFNDDKSTAMYAKKYVNFFANNEILIGNGANKFQPKDNITRAQMTKVLLRALKLTDKY